MIQNRNPIPPAEKIVQKTISYVKEILASAEGGHDWHHIKRVWNMAAYIREKEGKGDRLITQLAALLHDISDPKFNDGNEEMGSKLAFHFLMKQEVDRAKVEHIQSIIKHVSFKGGLGDRIDSIEFQIVQDADRLDAMGAIGIARAFNFGGFKNRPIHDPSIPLKEYTDSKAYYQSGAPTINHFYEKLLKLKDLMNTRTGMQLARERHDYMLGFLEQFYREVNPEQGGSG